MDHPVYSVQAFFVFLTLLATIQRLIGRRDALAERQFVALSVVGGVLVVAFIGALFRTMTIGWVLGLSGGGIGDARLAWIKATVALAAAGLSVHEERLLARREAWRRCWSQGIALVLAVIAIGAYFRFGDLGYSRFYHRHELFHYYLGSKYHRELGYERLYRCVAVAQADLGQGNEVRARKMIDLTTALMIPAKTALDDPEECRGRFPRARWDTFKSDVALFRRSSNLEYWNGMQVDHGYNPPPVWTMVGCFWASMHSPTEGYLQFLASFDVLLLAAMLGAIAWAFGGRVFAVAAIFWGCQVPGEYSWTGGAFLRQDWLFLLVASACLARRRRYRLAGAAFAYSTCLRVFPGILGVGWIAIAVMRRLLDKRWARSHCRLLLGCVFGGVTLVSISAAVVGPSAYVEFYRHIRVHKNTPLTNSMGLETVLSQSYEGRTEFARDAKLVDPFQRWEEMRRSRLSALRPLQLVLLGGLGLVLLKIARRVRAPWVGPSLSLVFLASVVQLTCYYYSAFILAALLSRLRKGIEQRVLAVAGISQLLAVNRIVSYYYDDKYVAQSILFWLFAASLLFAHWPRQTRRRTQLLT